MESPKTRKGRTIGGKKSMTATKYNCDKSSLSFMAIFLNFFPLKNRRDRSRVTHSWVPYLRDSSSGTSYALPPERISLRTTISKNAAEYGISLVSSFFFLFLSLCLSFPFIPGLFSFSLSTSFRRTRRYRRKRLSTVILLNKRTAEL